MQSQGSGINRDVCFTLNSTDVHAVAVIGVDLYNQTTTGGGINDCDIKTV